jgi:Glycosyl transferase family 2
VNDATRMRTDSAEPASGPAGLGAVAIGRNEGLRLEACLRSLAGRVDRLVYVDSGSSDGSVAFARRIGAEVVELDPARPFSAARARNAGLAALAAGGAPEYVQLVDGDCEVDAGWIATARGFLDAHPSAALVCGRRRERFPEASVYNRLCDWEWDTSVGSARACGGDALARTEALIAAGGYREDVIAAEDDELCVRLRAAGWEIWRIDAEMTRHDAAMHRFGQWWRRSVRAGHGFAQVGGRHRDCFAAERRRMLVWGAILPAAAVAGLLVQPLLAAAVAGLYGLSFARMAVRLRRSGMPPREAAAAAGLITVSKVSNLQGALTWWLRRLRGRATRIIEYK